MFLSQLKINPRSHDVLRDLAEPYQMHRTLCRAFDDKIALQTARLLYRVDDLSSGTLAVLVQTKTAPNWETLPADYCLEAPQTKEWQPQLRAGQTLSFRLRANPTVCKNGKRRGLYSEHDQLLWLARKAEQCGFVLPHEEVELDGEFVRRPAVQVIAEGQTMTEKREDGRTAQFRRVKTTISQHGNTASAADRTKHRAVFSAALFDGRLMVREPELFLDALQNGIGPAKAFGFGLLSLRRA